MPSLLSVSKPSKLTWQITLNAPPDNRLTDAMLAELGGALDQVEMEWRTQSGSWEKDGDTTRTGGALIITSAIQKFFSNGLDYQNSIKNPLFHLEVFSPVMIRLLTFPLPTIAAINGHAFAGGFLLAMTCDYRLMTTGRGWCCMNEIDFGAPFPPLFGTLLARKIPSPQTIRKVISGHRFTGPELLAAGVVDELIEQKELVGRAVELGEAEGKKVGGGSWGGIKIGVYQDVIEAGKRAGGPKMPTVEAREFFARMKGVKSKL